MICIAVKYHGPTNHRGSRFSATIKWGSEKLRATTSYDHAYSCADNEMDAAEAALRKMDEHLYETSVSTINSEWKIEACGSHPTTGESIFRAYNPN